MQGRLLPLDYCKELFNFEHIVDFHPILNMQMLFNALFKPYSLVVVRLSDGSTIHGTVLSIDEEHIELSIEDGSTMIVDSGFLSNAEYCYVGLPSFVEKETPLRVKGNGTITEYQNGRGYVSNNASVNYVIRPSSLVDSHLTEMAEENSIEGSSVLYVILENQKTVPQVATVIYAGDLDTVLDTISLLAADGKVTLAFKFSELVYEQFPEDKDVSNFYDTLKIAAEKTKPLDYYSSLPPVEDDELIAYGRIFEVGENDAYIIDAKSHKKLFFFKQQLFGGLESMSSSELIGQPVLYSVMMGNSGGYQARTILPTMQVSQAYGLARTLYFHNKKLNASDVLRLILEQQEIPAYRKELNAWMINPIIRDKLWVNEQLDSYNGKPEHLYSASPKKEFSITITRESTHVLHQTEQTSTPEVPVIMSASDFEGLKTTYSQPLETQRDSESKTYDESEEFQDRLQKDDIRTYSSVLPSLDNCPNGNALLEAEATIMVAWRDGTLFVKGEEKPFKFQVEDIIDEELRRRAMQYTTNYIQDEPVVCKLSYTEHRATHICSPKTVYEMLSSAKDAIILAREKDPVRDIDSIFGLYDAADGFASNVLDVFPDNTVAISLKEIAEKELKRISNTCHKAPFNAVNPCGTILSFSNRSRLYKVKDPLFSDYILLPADNIVDRDYLPREGDELVYSVYPSDERKGIPIIRFACLAKPAVDLIDMAEQWEGEGNYDNAWGIAMNVLDYDSTNPDAISIINRCQPNVSKSLIDERQRIIREDLFAQGQTAAIKEENKKAISIFTKLLESQDENTDRKELSALRILGLYNLMYLENSNDVALKAQYRKTGEMLILNKHNSPYYLPGKTEEEIEAFLQFYTDMGDIAGLIDSYKRKLDLIKRIPDSKEKQVAIADVNANLSWYTLLSGDTSDQPRVLAERAIRGENDLGQVCKAIFYFRLGEVERDIHEHGNFSMQSMATLTDGFISKHIEKLYNGKNELGSIIYERFALLCAIVKENKVHNSKKLLHYLGRYIATLTGNETDYLAYYSTTRTTPDDCNFVRQVFKCIQNGPAWRPWMDIRLLCMLSEESTLKISSAMFLLDPKLSASVLIRSGIDIKENPRCPVFARSFSQWRGASILAKYNESIKKANSFEGDSDLSGCIEFFRDLNYESWMIQDDQELINEFHLQLPELLSAFNAAETSRELKTINREIATCINEWLGIIKSQPTILMQCVYSNLLLHIRQEVSRIEAEQHYSDPVLKAKVLTTSAMDTNGSMFLELEIRNKEKRAEPMADCQLKIIATESIIPDVTNPVVSYSDGTKVYGDESIIYILCFKVHPEADLNGLFLKLIFTYSVKNTPKSEEFSFKIKPTRKWSDIENHFNPGAPAYNYFYGRQAYIKKVVSVFSDPKNTPHFFIYGQKRSGKSSVLYQIQKQLEERIPSAILVKVDFLSFELKSENDIFYHILKRILLNVETLNKKAQRDHSRDPLDPTCLVVPKKNEMDYDVLLSRLTVLKTIMQETRGWEESRLILFIDEFTIAYEGILEKLIPKDFMHRWKSLQAEGLFGAVLVGQDVLHSFIDETEGPNAFDILDKERLNYLEPEEASRLITETMEILSKRKDVFIGNAIERILYYSASSAHYTKWVCSRLVDYMNTRMLPKVTEADIDAAVSRSIKSSQPSTLRGLFDPLIFPGLKEKLSRFSWDQTTKILDLVADEEIRNPARGIRRIDLIAKSGETQEDIIKDLEERGVLENYHDYYKIKLKLYIVWYKERISLTTS